SLRCLTNGFSWRIEGPECGGRPALCSIYAAPARDTSCTTSAVFLLSALRATSACATIPQIAPPLSTTAIRRIWLSSIRFRQSSSEVSGVTETTVDVIASPAVRSSGFLPCATTRTVISRSVIIPIGIFESVPSTTGIQPQSQSTIIFATSCNPVSGEQHSGLAVITSFTFIKTSLSLQPPKCGDFYRRRNRLPDQIRPWPRFFCFEALFVGVAKHRKIHDAAKLPLCAYHKDRICPA